MKVPIISWCFRPQLSTLSRKALINWRPVVGQGSVHKKPRMRMRTRKHFNYIGLTDSILSLTLQKLPSHATPPL